MAKQPAARPFAPSDFFGDGRSARPAVTGTIARGQLKDDTHLHAGRYRGLTPSQQAALLVAGASPGAGLQSAFVLSGGAVIMGSRPFVHEFPEPVTRRVLERGRERFNIFCSVCHGLTGDGNGMVVLRGFSKPPSYHIPRLREAPVGHIFEVITKGYGAMPDLASQIPAEDRWAIIAYLRALQFSQNRTLADVPADARPALEKKSVQEGGEQ